MSRRTTKGPVTKRYGRRLRSWWHQAVDLSGSIAELGEDLRRVLAEPGRREAVRRRRCRKPHRVADRGDFADLVVVHLTSIWRASTCGSASACVDRSHPPARHAEAFEPREELVDRPRRASRFDDRTRDRRGGEAARGSRRTADRRADRAGRSPRRTGATAWDCRRTPSPSRRCARNVSYGEIDGCWLPIRGGFCPVAKKMPAGSDIVARIESKSAMSTACPRPVRSRSRSASRIPASMNWPAM